MFFSLNWLHCDFTELLISEFTHHIHFLLVQLGFEWNVEFWFFGSLKDFFIDLLLDSKLLISNFLNCENVWIENWELYHLPRLRTKHFFWKPNLNICCGKRLGVFLPFCKRIALKKSNVSSFRPAPASHFDLYPTQPEKKRTRHEGPSKQKKFDTDALEKKIHVIWAKQTQSSVPNKLSDVISVRWLIIIQLIWLLIHHNYSHSNVRRTEHFLIFQRCVDDHLTLVLGWVCTDLKSWHCSVPTLLFFAMLLCQPFPTSWYEPSWLQHLRTPIV